MFKSATTRCRLALIMLIIFTLNISVQATAQSLHEPTSVDFGAVLTPTPTDEVTTTPTTSPSPTPAVLPTPATSPTATPAGEPVVTPIGELTPAPDLEETSIMAFAEEIASERTITVDNYDEFAEALKADNGYEIIYLAANITMTSEGITINSSKSEVIIDGHPPGAVEGSRYTLRQANDDEVSSTINLASDNYNTKRITLRNMEIVGDDIYGMVYIPSILKNVSVTFESIEYDGPQIVTNRNGIVRLSNCDLDMHASGRQRVANLAEANHVELAGRIKITSREMESLLWLTNNDARLHVMEGAEIDATASGYFLHADSTPANIEIHPRAGVKITSELGFTHFGKNVKDFRIDEEATVHIIQNSPMTIASLRVEQTFEMKPNSALTIFRLGVNGSALYFPLSGGRAIFNNPKRVSIYNTGEPSINFATDGRLEITTVSLNMWQVEMSAFKEATHMWNDEGGKLFTIVGEYVDSELVNITTSLGNNAPIIVPLNETTFDLRNSMLVSFGQLDLQSDPLSVESENIVGKTEPDADVVFRYAMTDEESITAKADEYGKFTILVNPELLEVGQEVIVESTIAMLTIREIVTVQEAFERRLAFVSTPSEIAFADIAIPASSTLISPNNKLVISVEDTRISRNPWHIEASIVAPLSAIVAESTYTLPNALVFVDEDKEENRLSSIPLSIYSEESPDFGETNISWGATRGVQLRITPDSIYSNVPYTTTIRWALVDAP